MKELRIIIIVVIAEIIIFIMLAITTLREDKYDIELENSIKTNKCIINCFDTYSQSEFSLLVNCYISCREETDECDNGIIYWENTITYNHTILEKCDADLNYFITKYRK